jgi:hypothetical protein
LRRPSARTKRDENLPTGLPTGLPSPPMRTEKIT